MEKKIDPFITKLKLNSIFDYLTSKNWAKAQTKKSSLTVFRRPDDELSEIIFVNDSNLSDYKMRLSDALLSIAEFEKRSIDEVFNDLLLPESDVIKFRLSNSETADGTIPFKDALSFLESSKKALMTTATSILEPKKHFARIATKEAEDFINLCRFGQTERGSFVANIICPLNAIDGVDSINQSEMFPNLPEERFTRKVTKTFIKNIDYLAKAIQSKTTDKLLEPAENDIIISSNLCDSLLEMGSDNKFTLNISLKPAPIGPPIADNPVAVTIEKSYFSKIAELSYDLHEKEKPKKGKFIGQISVLKRDALHDDLLDGHVIISIFSNEKVLAAHVTLTKSDYEKACDIHKVGGYVSIDGTLIRRGKFQFIENYQNFRNVKTPSS